MLSHIMVATDFSPPAMIAVGAARDLASRFESKVTLAHVSSSDTAILRADADHALRAIGEEKLGNVKEVSAELLEGDRPSYVICEAAKEMGVELIVAGRHGEHKLAERLIGTTTERIARHAPCSVLSVHPATRAPLVMLKSIVIGTDLSEHALQAVRTGAEIARRFDAHVTLVHVYDLFPAVELMQEPYDLHPDHSFEGILNDKLEDLRKAELDKVPVDVRVLRDKSTVRGMCNLASDVEADLIVLGTHGLAGIERLLLGSVAERVIRHAPCSVMVVR